MPEVGEPLTVFDDADEALVADEVPGPEPDAEAEPAGAGRRRRRRSLGAAAFAVTLLVLVAAIPVLAVVGIQRLSDSRGGNLTQATQNPDEPGYLALVVPTRTALVVHRAPDNTLGSATLLSYTEESVGGTVLQIPLTTQVRNIRYVTTQLVQTYAYSDDIDAFHREVEDRLGVAIEERVVLSDGQFAELVRPVEPLAFQNPDAVVFDDGRMLDSGPVELGADDVGPFLRSAGGASSELAVLARNEVLWTAWLQAMGDAGGLTDAAVAATNLGPFLEALAGGAAEAVGATRVETLDVGPQVGTDDLALVPEEGFEAQINAAVPYPQSPGPGRRYSLKLLNGVVGEDLPRQMMHDLVMNGASLVQLGNGVEFGQEITTIEIADEEWQPRAEAARLVLGGEAEVIVMDEIRAADADVDMVITVGQDALRVYAERDGG